jgi:hypothetical protein
MTLPLDLDGKQLAESDKDILIAIIQALQEKVHTLVLQRKVAPVS